MKKNREESFLKIPINRIIALLLLDTAAVMVACYGAFYIRFDFSFTAIPTLYIEKLEWLIPINIGLTLFWFAIWKLYRSVWRYASATELLNILFATVCAALSLLGVNALLHGGLPRSYYALYWFILFGISCVTRFGYRILRLIKSRRTALAMKKEGSNVLIVGAGAAANAILKEIESSRYLSLSARCIIDDNPGCHGKYMRGIPIVGGREQIPDAVAQYNIDEIIFAIPSADTQTRTEILDICKETGCRLRTLPGMYQLINGDVSIAKLKEVDIEDLLGREPIRINNEQVLGLVQGKRILVTGGGGSIGSELCRQIAAHHPAQLIIVDIYENNAYDIQQELASKYPELALIVLIASVRNTKRINHIFETYRPQIVYHAAAHKHVPLMEDSPCEAIKNNVFGTYKTALAADRYGAEKFVLISTDKAVNPTNIMGASKRLCEMVVQMMNRESQTSFVAVRFGNVLGSNGSVIPLFKKQIEAGGPVTVTDPEIIRYFMTIPEAVSLVLQAGAYAKGGEIFVLDMGQPVKILDLAINLIKLSGYKPYEDIDIKFTGLRPGEKMYEELLMNEEGLKQTANQQIYIGKPIVFDTDEFKAQLETLRAAANEERGDIREVVAGIVETYRYQADEKKR